MYLYARSFWIWILLSYILYIRFPFIRLYNTQWHNDVMAIGHVSLCTMLQSLLCCASQCLLHAMVTDAGYSC
jgi:hypothetical protein